MTDAHFANFIAGIRTRRKAQRSRYPTAMSACTMLHLSNIAWKVNRELQSRPQRRADQGDTEAMKMWGREYEKGWEPRV